MIAIVNKAHHLFGSFFLNIMQKQPGIPTTMPLLAMYKLSN